MVTFALSETHGLIAAAVGEPVSVMELPAHNDGDPVIVGFAKTVIG